MVSDKCKHREKEEESKGKQVLRGLTAKQGFWQTHSAGETKIEVQSRSRGGAWWVLQVFG